MVFNYLSSFYLGSASRLNLLGHGLDRSYSPPPVAESSDC